MSQAPEQTPFASDPFLVCGSLQSAITGDDAALELVHVFLAESNTHFAIAGSSLANETPDHRYLQLREEELGMEEQ